MNGIIKTVGFWELGWNTPIKEVDLWEYPLRELGISQMYMSPISGIDNKYVKEMASLQEIFDENINLVRVYVDEHATVNLSDFIHPENALYVFGKNSFSPFISYGRPQDLSIKIPTVLNQGMFWSHQAASIILYDRFIKQQ